jgi:hypothetical protein
VFMPLPADRAELTDLLHGVVAAFHATVDGR